MKTILNLVDDGQLWQFHGGIYPPSRKERTKDQPISLLPVPQQLFIPLSQHSGAAAVVCVAVGDNVTKGQVLAKADGFISANVLAPSDGTITAICQHPACHPSGLTTETITLTVNDTDEQAHPVFAPLSTQATPAEILERVKASGITGLGGASFPTSVKLSTKRPIDYLILNGVECEPYITADDSLMRDRANDIVQGILTLKQLISPKRVIIAIEDNKPEAIKAMEKALSVANVDSHILVRPIPTVYPAGGEKQLIEVLTSKQIPKGKLPADIGVVVQNVATAYAVNQAVTHGQPLLERIVTVSGDLVSRPGNYQVPLGTSIETLLMQCGFKPASKQKIIVGGPMMGFALHDISAPVVKATNCIIAASINELPDAPSEQNCIRCGDCEQVCPAELLPQQLQWFAKDKDHDKLIEHDLFDCIECGACAYVCPSAIPLVQYYRVAKAEIRTAEQEKLQAARAKERYELRQARLERDKQEREERSRLAAEKRKAAMAGNKDQDAIAAALARVKAKKAGQSVEEPTKEQPNDRVAAAIARAKAKKAQANSSTTEADSTSQNEQQSRVAAAIARAKAKKSQAKPSHNDEQVSKTVTEVSVENTSDDKKARIAAAVAKAKAKTQAKKAQPDESPEALEEAEPSVNSAADDKKARIAAAVAKAKAKA
ncbi:electron transport complex subunit RsxC, partial [Psychrobium sp. 1_MG-2023]|uniref:electron transport complex subunit RsxC n=1 Tax=Psychrobium sp. 1_MG-2023 TaxID=3062624 RepID=UPI002735B962